MKYAVVTKSLLVLAVGTIFLLGFGLVPIYSLTLNWFGVWHKFELWRLVTSGATLGHPSVSVRNRFFFFFFRKLPFTNRCDLHLTGSHESVNALSVQRSSGKRYV